jgi:hypothetical protein
VLASPLSATREYLRRQLEAAERELDAATKPSEIRKASTNG